MKVTTDACLFGAWASSELLKFQVKGKMLEIGTGTGLLSLMIIQKNPGLIIDAIEIDPGAAKQAVTNISNSPYHKLINVINHDALNYEYSYKYDIIVSNPPFYEKELPSPDHKKNIALHSSSLSMTTLVDLIKLQLKNEGHFFILLPYKRNSEIDGLLTVNGLKIKQKIMIRQSVSHDLYRVLIHGIKTSSKEVIIPEEISIKDSERKYSAAFTSLLQEYYLNL